MSQPRRSDPLPLGGEDGLPYSKGLMARALIATGVSAMRSYELALRVETDLRQRGAGAVELERLQELAVEVLGEQDGVRAVGRLRRYRDLRMLDLPIMLLVGGATGTGKSTVATEVAHRLGITRVTSTDFIRQTMRAFFSAEFMPSVHYSSFTAGTALPDAEKEAGDALLVGFIDQTRHVLVGVQASIDRALEEGWSMVLEGVHLVPGMVTAPMARALVVHVVVGIENEDIHAQHFWSRDLDSQGARAHDKYLDRLTDIRHIQDFIVDEAQKTGVPVVQNGNIEQAIGTVMELVLERAAALQETTA
ncbi:MAG: 2-phosphoglycerate kinase [Gaiellaceae bacterium]